MTDLQKLYALIDELPREELDQLDHYIRQRRLTNVWAVSAADIKAIEQIMRPTHDLTATMDETEINAILDEALREVRRDRKTQSRD